MTWKTILERGTLDDFIEKASRQNYVYMIYEATPPYTAVDLAYSLYEISTRWEIPLDTVKTALHQHTRLRNRYFIEKVLTN